MDPAALGSAVSRKCSELGFLCHATRRDSRNPLGHAVELWPRSGSEVSLMMRLPRADVC